MSTSDTGQARKPAERGCQAKIAPSWANSWVTCGYAVSNGKCVKYGHAQPAESSAVTVQAPDVTALLRSHRDVERVCTGLGLTGWDGGWENDRVLVYAPRGREDDVDEVEVYLKVTDEHMATVPMGAHAVVLAAVLRVLLGTDTTPGGTT